MKIYHNSREIQYRNPFGAAKTQSQVQLKVITEGEPDKVCVRLWKGEEVFIPMDRVDENCFDIFLAMPDSPCLLWYYFVAEKDGKRYFCTRGREGVGTTAENCDGASWQITVYDKTFKTPDWFKNSIMYQIFPDRFFRKGEVSEIPTGKSERFIHLDWYELPMNNQHPFENGPACNDFYGGNLKGVCEKLCYLKELGISVIYLNPIFEAFSNHRYDTGNYSKIDSALGSEQDFEELCHKAHEMDIHIVLDGVFSHTGSDSIYFNKYRSYGDGGAYNDRTSPYRKWYCWTDDGYESWWGCSNLPNVNEMEPTYIDHILCGRDAIIKKWLRLGADGWRLDVADELPDEFIKILRSQVKNEKPDGLIIGEVWEDASNKESYGVRREYLLGAELDGVMNYPFRDGVIAFLTGWIDAETFCDRLMTIAEHYPAESLYATMNILGTHDTIRIKNALSGQDIPENMSRDEKVKFRLDAVAETLALKRLKLAVFMQITFVGVPCVYYGDEIGMQGLEEPCNRMPYTWRCVDPQLFEYYKKMIELRNQKDCLRCGDFVCVYARGGVFAYTRRINGGMDVFGNSAEDGYILCVLNRSAQAEAVELEIPGALHICNMENNRKLLCNNGRTTITLEEYEAAMFEILF